MDPIVNPTAAAPRFGAASTADPRATEAALNILEAGGSAVDAAIAAHAVIATVLPDSAGLGGDLLALVRTPLGSVSAVNGTGKSPAIAPDWGSSGGPSVTVPGIVAAWTVLHQRWGKLPMLDCLTGAIELASNGFVVDDQLLRVRDEQRDRLRRHGAGIWGLMALSSGEIWRQPELAGALKAIAQDGESAFYRGASGAAIVAAVAREGGSLTENDLQNHRTELPRPVVVAWNGGHLWVQPPASQGVLLAMAAQWVDREIRAGREMTPHALIEATEAAFAFRDDIAVIAPDSLLEESLDVDLLRAARKGGPRGYLHTAGVAVADRWGLVVSSLISVFDDFGSAVYVPALGIVLNNRADGFTSGGNAPKPGAFPVHTLAPALVVDAQANPLALATPGADGQVQTLLQVMCELRANPTQIDEALAAPRWRSQDGKLLIETGHLGSVELAELGHQLRSKTHGDAIFGAVVAAGIHEGRHYAAADPRRATTAGVR